MFSPDKQLKEIIIEEIRSDPVSISGLVRKLKARGIDIHRLILTGYLKALTDTGVIKEKAIPPSKIFTPVSPKETTIYEAISGACDENGLDKRHATAVAVYTLQKLFHRPVFRREIAAMGMTETPELKHAPTAVTSEARRILSKSGYRIPDSEPAFIAEGNYEKDSTAILLSAVNSAYRLSHLSLDTKQLTL